MKLKTGFKSPFVALVTTLFWVSILVIAILAVSCGPVNDKPAQSSAQKKTLCDPQIPTEPLSGSTPTAAGAPRSVISYSQNQEFIVATLLQDVDTGASPQDQPSPMTDNLYVFRFVNGHNLSVPSANAQLTVSYTHTTSTGTNTYNVPDVQRQGDHFIGTVHFGQAGNYALHLHLTDGKVQDDHVVYINL